MGTSEIMATISGMRRQERNYRAKDYLNGFRDQIEHPERLKGALDSTKPVDQQFRSRTVDWCYKIVSFCKFRREIVSISMNYLDRFLSTMEGMDIMRDRRKFQLAAITCLYTAIKTHEVEAIDLNFISNLSKGTYSQEQVAAMERKIILSLKWRLNPPTPCSYVRLLLSLMTNNIMSRNEKKVVMELVKYQTASSVREYHFVSYEASYIALASLTNAMHATKKGYIKHILFTFSKIIDIDMNSRKFRNCKDSLLLTLNKRRGQEENRTSIRKAATIGNRNKENKIVLHHSPRGVDTFPTHYNQSNHTVLPEGMTI